MRCQAMEAMHSKLQQARPLTDNVDTCRRVEEDQADAGVNQLVSVESVPIGDIGKPLEEIAIMPAIIQEA
jgi:hypothetical protein